MQWTRRHFLQITGSAAAAMGLGATGMALDRMLSGSARFCEWRALPGMVLDLTLEMAHPEAKSVDIIAQTEAGYFKVDSLKGAETLKVDIPYVETVNDSFQLLAVVRDANGRYCQSEPVEVIAEPFMFGM